MPLTKNRSGEGDDLQDSKSSLFGRKSNSATPQNANPYAQPPSGSPDPYAAQDSRPPSYTSNASRGPPSGGLPGGPRAGGLPGGPRGGGLPGGPRGGGLPSGPRGGGLPGGPKSTGPPGGGYGQNDGPYGGQAGYGASDRYNSNEGSTPTRRPGGYGGLGRTNSTETTSTEAGRQELFGDAAQRTQRRPPQTTMSSGGGSYGNYSSGYENEDSGGYGAYEDRQLTAEEQEEEDVQASKQEIRFLKQEDVGRTRNALRIAQQAEETGLATLQRLGQQGERIHNTERNLDHASNQNKIAEDKAREIKTLNRSMFAVHVNNPFTGKSRAAARDQAVMDKHWEERDEREATREAAYNSFARQQQAQKDLPGGMGGDGRKRDYANRQKYQFEADSEDETMEDEIEDNLDLLHGGAKRLNQIARAMGEEANEQNKHIARITGKTDKVDDQIAMNRARLDRIK